MKTSSSIVRKTFVLVLLSVLFYIDGVCQGDIPMGTWRLHLSYNTLIDLVNSDTKVFAASQNGIIILDKPSSELTTITKMDGLGNGEISAIGFHQGVLLIGFENGLINFISESEIVELDRLSESTAIAGSKRINHFQFIDNLAYLATDFGVAVLDIKNLTVKETYRDLGSDGTLLKIVKSAVYQDSLFLATEKGVISGSLDPSSNLLDFRNWNRYDEGDLDKPVSAIATFDDQLYASISGEGIYRLNAGAWFKEPFFQSEDYNDISSSADHLLIAAANSVHLVDKQGGQSTITPAGEFSAPHRVVEDVNGMLWIADDENGLVRYSNGSYSNFTPLGPSGNEPWRLRLSPSGVVNLRGGYDNSFNPLERTNTADQFQNGVWSNVGLDLTYDITDFAVMGDRDYFSSFGFGVQSVSSDGAAFIYDDSNSPLINSDPPNNAVFITSLQSGSDGLWVANYGVANSLHLLKPDLTWESFSFPTTQSQYPVELLVDGLDQVWALIDPAQGGGLFVFNRASNKSRYLFNQAGQGGLPSNVTLSIARDREGQIWVGTDQGVAYFPNPANIFEGSIDALRPIFENRFLLRDETVNTIAIDGGDRKWFGTDNGAWLFEDAGETLIYNFTSENSPLLDNHVVSIVSQAQSGEVFFATDAGLSSFRSNASESTLDFVNVKIFPNPVTREFVGQITINGLYTDAIVKVTDVSGRLIWETRANGGTATWSARQANGDRVGSGMYLVFATSEDGDERHVGKIAIID